MTVHTIKGFADQIPAGDYPNYFACWTRECEENRKLHSLLTRATLLLESEANRRERAGEDVTHLRAFITEARSA